MARPTPSGRPQCSIVGLFDDETAAVSQWHIPELHYLEDWSDARAYDGTISILQPVLAPLYDAHSAHEILATFTGQQDTSSHNIVKNFWQSQHNGGDFDSFWRTTLHDGVVASSTVPAINPTLRADWPTNIDLLRPAGPWLARIGTPLAPV